MHHSWLAGCTQNTDKQIHAIRDSSFFFNSLSSICIIKQSSCNIKEWHLGRDLSEITPSSPVCATWYRFTCNGLGWVHPKNSFMMMSTTITWLIIKLPWGLQCQWAVTVKGKCTLWFCISSSYFPRMYLFWKLLSSFISKHYLILQLNSDPKLTVVNLFSLTILLLLLCKHKTMSQFNLSSIFFSVTFSFVRKEEQFETS